MTGVARGAEATPLPSIDDVAAAHRPAPEPTDDHPIGVVIDRACRAAEELLLHLQLASAAAFGPTTVIEAAMADVAGSADALAGADAERRQAMAAAGIDGTLSLRTLSASVPEGPALAAAGDHLRDVLSRIERESGRLALELARRRADIDEVLRQAAGSPGIYDATGRTAATAGRRPRAAG